MFKLLKYTGINNYAIKLVDSQQLPYKLIYSVEPIKLKSFKAYIKQNLVNRFIKPSKSFTDSSIFFDQKSDGFLWLCVNLKGLNNFIIKN